MKFKLVVGVQYRRIIHKNHRTCSFKVISLLNNSKEWDSLSRGDKSKFIVQVKKQKTPYWVHDTIQYNQVAPPPPKKKWIKFFISKPATLLKKTLIKKKLLNLYFTAST
jgi:hypothetical protein